MCLRLRRFLDGNCWRPALSRPCTSRWRPENGTIVPALVTDPARWITPTRWRRSCRSTRPRAVAALTGKHAPHAVGVRAAPVRAARPDGAGQAAAGHLEGVILISMDCPGTFELVEYNAAQSEMEALSLEEYLSAACAEGGTGAAPCLRTPARCASSRSRPCRYPPAPVWSGPLARYPDPGGVDELAAFKLEPVAPARGDDWKPGGYRCGQVTG